MPTPHPTALAIVLLTTLLEGGGSLPEEVSDTLTDTIKRALSDALTEALPAVVRRAALPLYLTKAELAELTGWSERKIDYLRGRRLLHYHRVGRSILFRTEDIEHLLDEGRVEARAQRATTP